MNRKIIINSIALLDYKEYEICFKKMAAKGWMIDEVSDCFLEFKRINPADYKFCIDFLTGEARKEPEAKESYRDLCEQAGWTFVTEHKEMQVFYSKNKEVSLQTDETVAYPIFIKYFVRNFLIFLALIMSYSITFFGIGIEEQLILNFGIALLFLLPLTALFYVIYVIFGCFKLYWHWIHKMLRYGFYKPYQSGWAVKIRCFCLLTGKLLIILTVLFLLLSDVFLGEIRTKRIIAVSSILLLVIFLWILIKKIAAKRTEVSYSGVIQIGVLSVFLCFYVLPGGLNNKQFPLETPFLSMDGTLTNEIPEGTEISGSRSLLVPVSYKSTQYAEKGSSSIGDLMTDYYKTFNEHVADIIFAAKYKRLEKWFTGLDFKEIDTNLWCCDQGYLSSDSTTCLIRKGNIVIQILSGKELKPDEIQLLYQ